MQLPARLLMLFEHERVKAKLVAPQRRRKARWSRANNHDVMH